MARKRRKPRAKATRAERRPSVGRRPPARQPAVLEEDVKELGTDLVETNEQLSSIYEAEHQWRLNILKSNEEVARETVNLEVEIRSLLGRQEELQSKLKILKSKQQKTDQRVRALAKERSSVEKELELATARNQQLTVACREHERELEATQKENAGLSTMLERLEEDVLRLRKLKDEYLSSIARFKDQKKDLLT